MLLRSTEKFDFFLQFSDFNIFLSTNFARKHEQCSTKQ